MAEYIEKEMSVDANSLRWKDLVNRLPGGIGVYHIYPDDRVELEYLNDTFYAMMDCTREQCTAYTGFHTFDSVEPSDRGKLVAQLQRAIAKDEEVNVDIRVNMPDESYRWLNVRATVARRFPDKTAMYLLFNNVDEAHRLHQIAERSRRAIEIASQNGHLALWSYDLDTKKVAQDFLQAEQGDLSLSALQPGRIHPEDAEEFAQMYARMDEGCAKSEATVRIYNHRNNGYEWRHMVLIRQPDEEVESPTAIGCSINVDLQKEAEIRYERENRLRQELVKDAVVYYRINLTTRMVEELYSEVMDTSEISLPVSMERLVKDGMFNGCYEADRPLLETVLYPDHMLANYLHGKSTETFLYRRKLPNKGLRWLKASITKLKRVSSDEIIAFFTAIDIDEEKKDQILLNEVMDEEIESLITIKPATKEVRVIKENMMLGEYDPKHPRTGYFPLTQAFRDGLFQNMLEEDEKPASDFITTENIIEQLKKHSVVQGTYRNRMPDGTIRRKKVRAFYLDESKQDIVFVRRDITDLYNEEERQRITLQRAIDEADAANRAKSAFLSRISHDMRTPLNAIIGYSSPVLREDATDEQKNEFLDDIHYSGEYLLGIINDVLDMSKIENNKMVLHPEPYSYEEFKSSIQTVILPLCQKKGIAFEMNFPENVSFSTLMDKVRCNQIFINILSNAVKFTPEGGKIVFSARWERKNAKLLDATFSISDTGCGMSPEFLPHAFDSFTQEYAGQAMHNEQGTGLGLSIVKQFVELMGGSIFVTSKLGEGSTFTVNLPLTTVAPANARASRAAMRQQLQGLRLLLCEDHPMNRKIAVRLLEKQGCVVDTAEDGALGLTKFKKSARNQYDAILMDIRMPNMGGLEAAKAIRRLPRADAHSIPIIAMTANAFVEDKKDSADAGMNGHIAKPIDPVEMYATIYRLTAGRKSRRKPLVLVVDDIEMNAVIVARALRDSCETMLAADGLEALQCLKEIPDIMAVITDVQMPNMDGGELIRTIRRNPAYRNIALIANTQFGNSRMEEQMIQDGADDFIYKPTAPSLILSRVRNVLAKYRE